MLYTNVVYIVKIDKNLFSSFTLGKTSCEWYDFVAGK